MHCGDRNPVNLSVPAVTGATSYTWSLPQGWTISGSASGNSISAIPSGTNGGQVSVAANITCTTPNKAVNSTPITINYNSSLPTPTFNNAPYDIGNTASSFSITSVAGATSYTWEASSNILINGQVSPLQSTSTTVAISQRPGYSGAGWVKVTANSAQCGSSTLTKNVWVGQPEILYFSYFGSAKHPTCPYEQHTFAPVYSNGYQGQPSRYRWAVGNVSSHGDLTGSTLTVTAAGFNFSSRMSIGLEVETPLGWTQQFVMLYEIRDCDNGAEPMFSPNPVTADEFTLELSGSSDESYSYTLYDLQGNQRLSGKAKGKKTKVSTKGIPAGTYMLRIEHKGKSTTRRMIIKK
ncbi:Por secretion system C-terminal sorting domain-containing protein [Pontibacter lucknowensis]|uniref:Por secretion system C-terminal sorting domain-containing protein n=1 Tax=Pontibacter lucknowensis TaxID=1077936 RepID=A0A1N6U708_9BACT|nr:Por secretion system C-terminal sorting domain-containing protein [Pontibacter lucknowensis]